MTDYATFLATKRRTAAAHGRTITDGDVHPMLHPWQKRIVTWAVQRGRAALWADTGIGKTSMQLEYGTTVRRPLPDRRPARRLPPDRPRSRQTRHRRHATSAPDTDADGPGIWVTNYEMAAHVRPGRTRRGRPRRGIDPQADRRQDPHHADPALRGDVRTGSPAPRPRRRTTTRN